MSRDAMWLIGASVLASTAQVAYATQYLTQEQAQKAIFPEAGEFRRQILTLTPEQRTKINAASKTGTPLPENTVWQAWAGGKPIGWFVIDEVYGKHEYITYALGIDTSGAIRRVEIMDYRETHGAQVGKAEWLSQFIGKKQDAKLKLNDDILNISGATLSCLHLADGVRRLLALHELVLGKGSQ